MNHLAQLDAEMWLAERMKLHGIFDGVTTTASRKEAFREACLKFSQVIAGKRSGKSVNYAQAFELVYGEPLTPPSKSRATGRAHPPDQTAPAETGSGR